MTTNAQSRQPNPLIAGFHSDAAYPYSEEDSEAIIKTVSYHRKDFDQVVIWFPPRTHVNVASSLAADYRKPTASFGDLEKLPPELITNICLQLDIASLFQLRQVNARGQQFINALHEYRVAITHGLNALLALLRTKTMPGVTLEQFYALLCTQNCSLCGEYGNLVYLLTWTRCCSSCLETNSIAIRTTNRSRVERTLKLSKTWLESLPRLSSLPGAYTLHEIDFTARSACVSVQGFIEAYRKDRGEEPSLVMIEFLSQASLRRISFNQNDTVPAMSYLACSALPSYDPHTNQVENGLSCAGCQLFVQEIVSRLHQRWARKVRDAVYTREGFLEHFAWCEQAQFLWKESEGGTKEPRRLPFMCKRGGLLDLGSSHVVDG